MKKFVSGLLSVFLSTLSLVVKLLVFFPSFFVLGFPFWLALLAAAFITLVPVLGSLLNIVLWIWALIVCLNSPVTTLSIIFYVLFAVYALDLAQAIVRASTSPIR